jgi:hypothetical protein
MLSCCSRKILLKTPVDWSHHDGGWNYLMQILEQHLHIDNGLPLYTNAAFADPEKIEDKAWLGFCHFGLLEAQQNVGRIKQHLANCKGVFVHSQRVADVLKSLEIPVNFLWHGTKTPTKRFSWETFLQNPKIVSVGHWLRRHDRFQALQYPSKFYLECKGNHGQSSIPVIPYLPSNEYEDLLTSSVVFLDLADSSCNNTLLECLVRDTPLLTNRLPTTEEYLGSNYPLFFENEEELNYKAHNHDLQLSAHAYLSKLPKSHLTRESYLRSFYHSEIYSKLP